MRFVVAVWRLFIAGLAVYTVHELATASGFSGIVFFTNQSTILAAVVFAWAGLAILLRGDQPPAWLKGAMTLYMSITALVSAFILAPEAPGNPEVFLGFTQTGLKHVLLPILIFLDFLLLDRHRRYRWAFPGWWLLFPVAYMIFTTLRGGFWPHVGYPYPFVDVAELGYLGLAQNVVIYGVGFWVLGAVLVGLDRILPKRSLLFSPAR